MGWVGVQPKEDEQNLGNIKLYLRERRRVEEKEEGRRRGEEREESSRRRGEEPSDPRRRVDEREEGRRRQTRLRSGDSLINDEVQLVTLYKTPDHRCQ